jgi:hypothetical protein
MNESMNELTAAFIWKTRLDIQRANEEEEEQEHGVGLGRVVRKVR